MSRAAKLTKRSIDAAKPDEKRYAVLDTDLPGFRLYVRPSGKKTFHLRYRVGGGRDGTIREPKIGDFGELTADQARRIASEWLAEVRKGGDPSGKRQEARKAPRMADLFDRYLTDHARPHKKASSVANDERLIANRLRPAFEKKKVAEVTRAHVSDFHKSLSEKPYEANRVLALLSKAFNLAEVWGWRPDGSNPCRHVQKYPEKKRKRFLSPAELASLGEALRLAESGELTDGDGNLIAVWPYAVPAIRLLILTGARKSEILELKWDWIDFENARINLPDSKTGEKPIHLGAAALEVLNGIPRVEGNPHVIVGTKEGGHFVNLKDPWGAIRKAAGLDDVRIHDLRHSFASVGASGGMSLPIIGALLGHTQAATTQRYAHLADDPLKAAASEISGKVAAAMEGEAGKVATIKGEETNK